MLRPAIPGLFLVTMCFLNCSGPGGVREKELPNIVLISLDTLRADHVSSYGCQHVRTPNIDSIGQGGTRLANFVAHSPWTKSSFGSLFTSLYPSQHGSTRNSKWKGDSWEYLTTIDQKLDDKYVTMAEILKDNGYVTVAFQANVMVSASSGFSQGFDIYEHESLFHEEDALPYPPANRMYEAFNSWLSEHSQTNRRFFVWINLMDTHMPYVGRKGYYPESWDSRYHGQITNPFKDYKTARNGPGLSEKDKEQIHALYDAEIQFADEYIGKILEALKRTGLEDKILLIFASDHGEELWDHGGKSEQDVRDFNWGFGHGHTLYEEMILVPLIIRYPVALGQPGEMTTVNQQIRQVDFLPTILDLLEIRHEAAKHFEGESILDLLRGESSKSPAVFSESLLYGDEKKSIRTGGYKLVFNAASGETELYDLINDPGEEINIVDSQSERAQSLKKTLIQWMQRMPPSVLTVH